MGPKMTAALVAQLNAHGYQAQALESVSRPAASLDNIDYKKDKGHRSALCLFGG